MGVIDSLGIEMVHPNREDEDQVGKKGISNHRWIIGVKVVVVLNNLGRVVDWMWDSAHTHDNNFTELIERVRMALLGDKGFHKKEGDPENLLICSRWEKNVRMLIETVFSQMYRLFNLKHISEQSADYVEMHLGFALSAFNLLVDWESKSKKNKKITTVAFPKFAL